MSDDKFERVAEVLTLGFETDPLFVEMWPDPGERARSLRILNRMNLNDARSHGKIVVTEPSVNGIAIAFRGEDFESGDDTAGELEAQFEPNAWKRFHEIRAFTYADRELLELVSEPHWYLHMIAVDPARQGQGIGSALLRAIHDEADIDGRPTLLVTFQPRNVPLYRRHGYEIVAEGTEPSAGLYYWSMKRPPAS